MCFPLYVADKRKVLLGAFHIAAGLSILIIWYGLDLDLVEKITALTATLPMWTVAFAGLVEGSYWIGGLIPGQSYIGLYLLGHECSVGNSSAVIFYIWFGVLTGLLLSYGAACLLKKRGVAETEDRPWALSKIAGRVLLAAYPSAAATHLFERGFQGKTLLPSLVPIVISGLVILTIYTVLLCSAKEVVYARTGEIGLLFGGVLIVWGMWRVAQGVRKRGAAS